MILSGKKIKEEINKGIFIEPFDEKRVNPNSYNIRLADDLAIYKNKELDMKNKNELDFFKIPPEGYVLQPGTLYLGRTVEKTFTDKYVPMIEGRSSIGRLGIYIHVTAGFGDIGFNGYWTLEITCIQPVRIYANTEIGQVYFHTIEGDFDLYSSGKYSNNTGIQGSKLYEDFLKGENKSE